MKKKKQNNLVLFSLIIILLCVAIMVGESYSYFTSSKTLVNHIQAGNLKISLDRLGDGSYKTVLNENGILEKVSLSSKDFTDATDENIFGISDEEYIVPGSTYISKLKITNSGTVAFTYDVKIDLFEDDSLANQLKIYLDNTDDNIDNYTDCGYLSNYLDVQGIISSKDLYIEMSNVFTIKIVFEDNSSINNIAMDRKVKFDLFIQANQIVN